MKHITRRSFLKTTFGTAAVLSMSPVLTASRTRQPNILWISCEDISPHLGCYGEKFAITPNIDQFAREGVRYTRAFTVHGVCAPSRSGIITGMYPSSIGSVNMRCGAMRPDEIKCFPEYLRPAGYYCTNNAKEDYNFVTPKTVWDDSSNQAHWKNRPEGKPFFAVFNFTNTHESKLWNSADFDNTHSDRLKKSQWQKPENMTVPPIYPDVPAIRQDLARLFERITEFDYFVKDRIDELKEAGLYENTVIFIWSDHGDGLPRAKRWTYDSGTLSPLLVRIPERYRIADQAKPGSVNNQLINFIDLGPSVLNLVGIKTPEHMQGRPFLGPDLPSKRHYIFGARQRIDELSDMVRSVRNKRYRYLVNFMPYIPYLSYLEYGDKCNTMKAMRREYAAGKQNKVWGQWMADHRPAEELYDLDNDPWETRNLADDPGYAEIKKLLRQTLIDWMIETRDTGLMPEPEMMRLRKNAGGEWFIFHQPGGEERVKKLVKLALTAANPTDADRKQIETALTDNDPIARYWATLAMRGYADNTEKLDNAAGDENGCVRIAAAWALYLTGQKDKGVSVLIKELKKPEPGEYVLQLVLKVLDLMDETARAALPVVKAIPKHPNEYINRTRNRLVEKYDASQY